MLKLSRRIGESLLIGEDVEVEIIDIKRGQVQIGIRAPREVTILRKEIALTIRENAVAARSVSDETISRLLSWSGPIPSIKSGLPTDKTSEHPQRSK